MLSDSELLAPGAMLGKYQLLRRLAVGGMAEIYLARASGPAEAAGFEKLVVLKRILPQHAVDRQFLRMFLDEARLMATLSHPGITQVYDVGVEGTATFFTMEYVHGEDLRDVLEAAGRAAGGTGGAALPLAQAIAIVASAAAGLHCAHEKEGPDGQPLGIVHRDVSPSNVLLSYDGAVKVTDFGVAKWATQQSETRHGTLKGKVGYMSPEQCRGEPLDRRSDVFALGILLYETTTGRRPFRGDSDFEVMGRIANHDVAPPSAIIAGYPAELERIVLRALRRNRDERYAGAQDLQVALEELAREQKLVTSPVALGRTMQQLFGEKIAAWRAAREAGKSLGQHLAEAATVGGETLDATATDLHAPASVPARVAPQRRSRIAAAAIGGVLFLAAALGSAMLLRGDPRAGPPPSPALPAPSLRSSDHARGATTSTPAPAARTVDSDPSPTPIRIQKRAPRRAPAAGSALKVWDPDSPVPP